jgi:hypothetical protein
MTDFDYQQWRKASAVTPEMLDSCLDRIAELEAENKRMKRAESTFHDFYHSEKQRAEQAESRSRIDAHKVEMMAEQLADVTAERDKVQHRLDTHMMLWHPERKEAEDE